MRKLTTALAFLTLAAACGGQTPAPAPRADSLLLERSACFGSCPVYRLTLRADGTVSFAARTRGDSSRVEADSIGAGQFGWLVQQAERIGFFTLPSVIYHDRGLCPVAATDHPTATVTIYRADSTVSVTDYQGCAAGPNMAVAKPLADLRHFERQIDSVAMSARWIRPGSR